MPFNTLYQVDSRGNLQPVSIASSSMVAGGSVTSSLGCYPTSVGSHRSGSTVVSHGSGSTVVSHGESNGVTLTAATASSMQLNINGNKMSITAFGDVKLNFQPNNLNIAVIDGELEVNASSAVNKPYVANIGFINRGYSGTQLSLTLVSENRPQSFYSSDGSIFLMK